jgi:hypothetical protein
MFGTQGWCHVLQDCQMLSNAQRLRVSVTSKQSPRFKKPSTAEAAVRDWAMKQMPTGAAEPVDKLVQGVQTCEVGSGVRA